MNRAPCIAYLSNHLPSPVEPYVVDEIEELRRRGVAVVACSARRIGHAGDSQPHHELKADISLLPLGIGLMCRAAWLSATHIVQLAPLLKTILLRTSESFPCKLRAIAHTFLGACLAHRLARYQVDHIHVHHGYFSAWIALTAARLLHIEFSMTLHGSDVLLGAAFLDVKLQECKFCTTISDFNRRFMLKQFPDLDPAKILVHRLGVDALRAAENPVGRENFAILAVGRLHSVKDHAFLLRACHQLKERGLDFRCRIAGDGPERANLELLIRQLSLEDCVQLLGHVGHARLGDHYAAADLVVLTSRSEGIPLTLMEAMAQERLVLAPAITGIPELVRDEETGFLYQPGSLDDLVNKIEMIHSLRDHLHPIRQAARVHVARNFDRATNLAAFLDLLVSQLISSETPIHAHSLLQ